MSRQLEEARVAALLEEQERMVVEEHIEKVCQQEETEVRLAKVTFEDTEEVKELDHSCDDAVVSEITDQEREEKPYELMADDDTRVTVTEIFHAVNSPLKSTILSSFSYRADRGGRRA